MSKHHRLHQPHALTAVVAKLIEPVPHRSVLRRKYMVEFVSARVEGLWGLTAVAKVEDALRQRRCRCTVRPHAQCVEESNQRKLEHLLVPLCVIHLAEYQCLRA